MGKLRVAILFGGRSVEHEISVISGIQLIEAIDRERIEPIPVYIAQSGRWYSGDPLLKREFYKNLPSNLSSISEVSLLPCPGTGGLTVLSGSNQFLNLFSKKASILPVDLYIPVFHGDFGEDGCIQGLFELADVPYVGSDVMASALSMNKYLCKLALKAAGIPVLPCKVVERERTKRELNKVIEEIVNAKELGAFPFFVKPAHLGSSIGASRAKDEQSLKEALVNALKHDTHALIEPCITNLMEINVAVKDGDVPIASVVEIPVPSVEVLSYEDKYMRSEGKKSGGSEGMAGLTRVIDPADLDQEMKHKVISYGLKVFSVLGCGGAPRLDFMVNVDTRELFFNEINPIPGSMAFYLWAKSKPTVTYTQLINELIDRALEVRRRRESTSRDLGFKAMFGG